MAKTVNRSLRKPLFFVHSKALLLKDLQTCEKIFDFFTAAKPKVFKNPSKSSKIFDFWELENTSHFLKFYEFWGPRNL